MQVMDGPLMKSLESRLEVNKIIKERLEKEKKELLKELKSQQEREAERPPPDSPKKTTQV